MTPLALAAASPVFALLFKATLILVAGGAVSALAHRRPAATRHFVWLVAIAGSLALLPLTRVAPRIPIRVPDTRTVQSVPGENVASRAEHFRRPRVPRSEAPLARDSATPVARATDLRVGSVGMLVWLAGCISVLLWGALGQLLVRRLGRTARELEVREWRPLLSGVPGADRVGARVKVAVSRRTGTPLTWGSWRPVVLLPDASLAWPAERRRAALLHELAHVRRGDALAQLLATLACAVYWFHPLVWWSALRLRAESEHACDDDVLAAGTPAPEYASDLLEVARGARELHAVGFAAVGMARRSQLEGRLLAVLDETRPRGRFPARAAVVAIPILALGLVPLAGLEARLVAAGTGSKSSDAGPTSERMVDARAGGLLELDLETGGAVTVSGWDQPKVNVRYRLGGQDWRDSRVAIEPSSGGVRVRAWQTKEPDSYSTSHHFEIQVPRRFDVTLHSSGGGLKVADVQGTLRGNTGGGEISITRAKGHAELSTGGGDIQISDSDLGGSVSTGGGEVRLSNVRGGLRGSSGSGPVIYADGAKGSEGKSTGDLDGVETEGEGVSVSKSSRVGALHITKAGGDVDLEDAPQGATISTGGGDVRVRHGAGDIEVYTGGGGIEIGPVAGTVSAETGAGAVTITLDGKGTGNRSADVTSGTGKVVLILPANLDARFDLETAYTREDRRTRITSAWQLERPPVTDWDDHQGTARRYVRARGVAGAGHGLIQVRTVNGDIEVRRRP